MNRSPECGHHELAKALSADGRFMQCDALVSSATPDRGMRGRPHVANDG